MLYLACGIAGFLAGFILELWLTWRSAKRPAPTEHDDRLSWL